MNIDIQYGLLRDLVGLIGSNDCMDQLQLELISSALDLDNVVSEKLPVSGSEEIFPENDNENEIVNDHFVDYEYQNYLDSYLELQDMCGYKYEPISEIKARFEILISEVNVSHGIRQDVCDHVFNGDSLRFGRFLRSRNKIDFLDKSERRAFDLLAMDLCIDEMELIDRLRYDYNAKEKAARLKELKKYRDYCIQESLEYENRIGVLSKIVSDYENRYSYIDNCLDYEAV